MGCLTMGYALCDLSVPFTIALLMHQECRILQESMTKWHPAPMGELPNVTSVNHLHDKKLRMLAAPHAKRQVQTMLVVLT